MIIGVDNQPGFDLVIPITRREGGGQVSSLAVQIKCYINFTKTTFDKCIASAAQNLPLIPPPSISTYFIIMNIGTCAAGIDRLSTFSDVNNIQHVCIFISLFEGSTPTSSFSFLSTSIKNTILNLRPKFTDDFASTIGPEYELVLQKIMAQFCDTWEEEIADVRRFWNVKMKGRL